MLKVTRFQRRDLLNYFRFIALTQKVKSYGMGDGRLWRAGAAVIHEWNVTERKSRQAVFCVGMDTVLVADRELHQSSDRLTMAVGSRVKA